MALAIRPRAGDGVPRGGVRVNALAVHRVPHEVALICVAVGERQEPEAVDPIVVEAPFVGRPVGKRLAAEAVPFVGLPLTVVDMRKNASFGRCGVSLHAAAAALVRLPRAAVLITVGADPPPNAAPFAAAQRALVGPPAGESNDAGVDDGHVARLEVDRVDTLAEGDWVEALGARLVPLQICHFGIVLSFDEAKGEYLSEKVLRFDC